jgi:hypothetical protein
MILHQPARRAHYQFSTPDNPKDDDSALRAAAGPLRIEHLHPVYHLEEAVAGGRNLDAAELTGYRYLVQEGAGELSTGNPG